MIIDDFLPEDDYRSLKNLSLTGTFKDEANDIDGVVYPDIMRNLPEALVNAILSKASSALGRVPVNPVMFMRMSKEGVKCPHMVHHDGVMGDYSLMLYLNDGDGGTSLVVHRETGITYAPENDIFAKIIQSDQNNPEAWRVMSTTEMRENRAFIFNSKLLHCAEPVGGFGDCQSNSRIVLTCFFS